MVDPLKFSFWIRTVHFLGMLSALWVQKNYNHRRLVDTQLKQICLTIFLQMANDILAIHINGIQTYGYNVQLI